MPYTQGLAEDSHILPQGQGWEAAHTPPTLRLHGKQAHTSSAHTASYPWFTHLLCQVLLDTLSDPRWREAEGPAIV